MYEKTAHGSKKAITKILDFEEGLAACALSPNEIEAFREEVMLIEDMFPSMDKELYNSGKVSPVFFGSALNNFGLDVFLKYFHQLAPPPQPYIHSKGSERVIDEPFSGFIFKMQANMNPGHRDCAAFIRVASGEFKRGLQVVISHTGKKIKLATPHTLMGDERSLLEEAFPGDIVSIFNPGDFKIGTTIYEKKEVHFDVIPLFTPEHFQKVATKDPFKRKQLREGLQQLSEEGVVHVFEVPNGVGNELLLGTVGVLQFEVVEHRMREEYGVDLVKTPVSYYCARWLPNDKPEVIEKLQSSYSTHVTNDMDENPIVLLDSMYALNQAEEKVGAENLFKFKQG